MKLYTYSTLEERVQKPHISCLHIVATHWIPKDSVYPERIPNSRGK